MNRPPLALKIQRETNLVFLALFLFFSPGCGSDIAVCLNGDIQPGLTPCGPNLRGVLQQICNDGQWAEAAPETCLDAEKLMKQEPRGGGEKVFDFRH